jgi:hypothetical protein
MDFNYNSSRKRLVLPEYGRNIQNMVDYVCNIQDRDERNRLAKGIITVMGNMNPHLRDVSDFKHKLWDHLAIMADFKLDIDWPYPLPAKETLNDKPRRVAYNTNGIRYKHYGKVMEQLIRKASEMEASEERQVLVTMIANHMKKSYLTWNREAVTDEVIFHDLEELSKGKLTISREYKLAETKDILSKNKKKKSIKKRHE